MNFLTEHKKIIIPSAVALLALVITLLIIFLPKGKKKDAIKTASVNSEISLILDSSLSSTDSSEAVTTTVTSMTDLSSSQAATTTSKPTAPKQADSSSPANKPSQGNNPTQSPSLSTGPKIVEGDPAIWHVDDTGSMITEITNVVSDPLIVPNRINGKDIKTIDSWVFSAFPNIKNIWSVII